MCCSLALLLTDLRDVYDVVSVTSTEDVKLLLENIRIDLIMADVHTPKGDIIKTLSWAKKEFPKMPIVMFYISFSNKELEERVFEISNACISKPFENEEVIDVINEQFSTMLT